MERWYAAYAYVDVAAVLVGFVCFLCVGAVYDRAFLHADMWPRCVDVEVVLERSFNVDEQLSNGIVSVEFASMYTSFTVEVGFEEGGGSRSPNY